MRQPTGRITWRLPGAQVGGRKTKKIYPAKAPRRKGAKLFFQLIDTSSNTMLNKFFVKIQKKAKFKSGQF